MNWAEVSAIVGPILVVIVFATQRLLDRMNHFDECLDDTQEDVAFLAGKMLGTHREDMPSQRNRRRREHN